MKDKVSVESSRIPPVQAEISLKLLQRCVIWWLWKQDKNLVLIHSEMETVFGEEVYSERTIWYWLHEFRNGRDRIQDLPRSGRPSSMHSEDNVESVLEVVLQDRRQRVSDIALAVDLSHSSVHRILRMDLKFHKKSAKFVPKILTAAHKDERIECCQEALDWIRFERNLSSKVITGDESYVHLYTPETKEASKQWLDKDDPRPQKALQG